MYGSLCTNAIRVKIIFIPTEIGFVRYFFFLYKHECFKRNVSLVKCRYVTLHVCALFPRYTRIVAGAAVERVFRGPIVAVDSSGGVTGPQRRKDRFFEI